MDPDQQCQHHPEPVRNAGSRAPPARLNQKLRRAQQPAASRGHQVIPMQASLESLCGVLQGNLREAGQGRCPRPRPEGLGSAGRPGSSLGGGEGRFWPVLGPSRPLRWWGRGDPPEAGASELQEHRAEKTSCPKASTKGPAWEPVPRWGSGGWSPRKGSAGRRFGSPRAQRAEGPSRAPAVTPTPLVHVLSEGAASLLSRGCLYPPLEP